MTPAIKLLEKQKVPHQVLSYEHDPSNSDFGSEAASKLAVDPHYMFKTLVVRSDTGQLAMVLVSVADKVDLKKLAAALGTRKADLADPGLAEKTTGYVVGGISPLGGRKRLPVYVDTSLISLDTVYISAGKRGLQLKLSAVALVTLLEATVAPLV
ncbi:MAG: Cys-tRNA(Pro) deacylase [Gemmatales bacterium]